jgi:hypothetical protein
MEPEGSLSCSQEPSTGPHPEPDEYSLYHPILSKIYYNIVTDWRYYATAGYGFRRSYATMFLSNARNTEI